MCRREDGPHPTLSQREREKEQQEIRFFLVPSPPELVEGWERVRVRASCPFFTPTLR
jgi:hypothetical protein